LHFIETLLTYVTTLAFYLHLRASEKYAHRPDLLKTHPVFARLLTLKQSLITLEDLDFAVSDSEYDQDENEDADEGVGISKEDDTLMDGEQLWKLDRIKGLEADELEELLRDASSITNPSSKHSKVNFSFSEDQPPKKKRKTSSESTKSPLPVFDLVEPVFTSSKIHSSPTDGGIDTYGEATYLQHADAADKTARKKSLRFHTSKIENASARRLGARSKAVGGDDDLPYRERRKAKEARLSEEAKTRTRGQGGDDLDDVEPQTKDEKRKIDAEDNVKDEIEGGPDGYYELVKWKSKETKDQKRAEYEAAKAAMRYGFRLVDMLHRIIIRLILKVRTLMTTEMPQDLALSPERYWQTGALLLTARKACAIRESRSDSGLKRPKRRFRLRKLSIRVGLGILGGTTVKSQVFPKLSRAFAWDKVCVCRF
jgi:U3 small nucleolar RNA-associated protein 3